MSILWSIKTTLFHTFSRTELTPWRHEPTYRGRIYGFYHVYCADGWQGLVTAQMQRLRQTGMMAATDTLYVSIITLKDTDFDDFMRIAGDSNVEIVSRTGNGRLYEYPALEALRRRCEAEDCLVYYFHTKGVSFHSVEGHDRQYRRFKRNVEAWREMMEHFLMDEWQVAVNVLCDGYDTYGCGRYPPRPARFRMYCGNFWWASSRHIRKLPVIRPELMADDRMKAETWLYEAEPHDFSAFDFLAILYRVYMPRSLYTMRRPPLWDVICHVVHFNVTKIRKLVFRHDYVKGNNTRFQNSVTKPFT